MAHTTVSCGFFAPMLLVISLGSLGCQKTPSSPSVDSAAGSIASTDQLLEEIFDGLDHLESLDAIARRASSTPGVRAVEHDPKANAVRIEFDPPIAAADVAVNGMWDDTFVVESPHDHSWFLVVYDRKSSHGGSYQSVAFTVPKHGPWQVIAVATGRPSGPPPEIGSDRSGAYPLVDHPVRIKSIAIHPVGGR